MIKIKLYKTKTDNELFYYFNAKKEKMFMYRHRYTDSLGDRRERSKQGFTNENKAYRSLLEVRLSITNGDIKQVENEDLTVAQWFDIWYETESNAWEISTKKQREQIIKNYIKPLLGKYKLRTLNRSTYVREYINVMLEKHQANSVQLRHVIFNIAINDAVENEIISRNRFTKVKFEQVKKNDNFLTPNELNVFLHTAPRVLDITKEVMVFLLTYSGIRHGELLGLRWSDVDFKENHITIQRTRDSNGTRTPKTKNSYRRIPIDQSVINKIKRYKRWCKSVKFRYGERIDKEKDYIFINERNEKCSQEVLRNAFSAIYRQLKKDGLKIRKITPHGLRHTHATILIINGIPAQTIADRLGNSVEMVYKVYTHSFEEMEQKAMKTFSHVVSVGGTSGGN